MPFDDPEDNFDEATTSLRLTSPLSDSISILPQQVSGDQGSGTGQTIGQRIMQIGRQPGIQPQMPVRFTEREDAAWPRQTGGVNTGDRGIGQRILELSAKGNGSMPASWPTPTPEERVSKWGFEQPKEPNVFASFVPASADPSSGNTSPSIDSSDQHGTRSKIPKQSSVPLPSPPKLRPDQRQEQKTLSRLMTGLRGPAMTPMGVAPSGALMLDLTSQVKAPSRIRRQYDSGEHYSNINTGLIQGNEGGTRVKGYVPPKQKHAKQESGVTVAAGFDVGQHNLSDLKGFEFSKELTAKLAPYVGLKGKAAKDALAKNPVTITADEAKQINSAVLNSKLNAAGAEFNRTSKGAKFSDLPWQAQTAIADLWYNMGKLDAPKVAPRLWKQVTSGDWEAAYQNLRHFAPKGTRLADRAKGDAKLLRDAIDIGWLPND